VRWLHLGLGEGEWRDAGKFAAFYVWSCHPRTAKQSSPTIPIRAFCMRQDGTLKHPSGRVFQASLTVKANEIDCQKKYTEKRSSSTEVRYREFRRLLEEIEGVNTERNTHRGQRKGTQIHGKGVGLHTLNRGDRSTVGGNMTPPQAIYKVGTFIPVTMAARRWHVP